MKVRAKTASVSRRTDGFGSSVFYMGIFIVSAVVGVFSSQN